MSTIEFLLTWTVLAGIFLLGYFARRGLEIYNKPTVFKRIVSGPIHGEDGNLNGRYVLEGLDGNIHYAHPPFTLTLD